MTRLMRVLYVHGSGVLRWGGLGVGAWSSRILQIFEAVNSYTIRGGHKLSLQL